MGIPFLCLAERVIQKPSHRSHFDVDDRLSHKSTRLCCSSPSTNRCDATAGRHSVDRSTNQRKTEKICTNSCRTSYLPTYPPNLVHTQKATEPAEILKVQQEEKS